MLSGLAKNGSNDVYIPRPRCNIGFKRIFLKFVNIICIHFQTQYLCGF